MRLPRAWSSLTLTVSRDGVSTISLGNMYQCFTTLTVKDFFSISNLNLPFVLEDISPCSVIPEEPSLLKSLSSFFSLLSCTEDFISECSTPGDDSPAQSRGEGSPPLLSWTCFFWCSPGYGWLCGLRGHIVGSRPVSHPPVTPGLFQQGCAQSFHLPVYIGSGWCLNLNPKPECFTLSLSKTISLTASVNIWNQCEFCCLTSWTQDFTSNPSCSPWLQGLLSERI